VHAGQIKKGGLFTLALSTAEGEVFGPRHFSCAVVAVDFRDLAQIVRARLALCSEIIGLDIVKPALKLEVFGTQPVCSFSFTHTQSPEVLHDFMTPATAANGD